MALLNIERPCNLFRHLKFRFCLGWLTHSGSVFSAEEGVHGAGQDLSSTERSQVWDTLGAYFEERIQEVVITSVSLVLVLLLVRLIYAKTK